MAKFAFAAVLLIACARRGAPPAPAAAAVRVPPQVAWEEGASTLDPSLRGQALALLIRTAQLVAKDFELAHIFLQGRA